MFGLLILMERTRLCEENKKVFKKIKVFKNVAIIKNKVINVQVNDGKENYLTCKAHLQWAPGSMDG